ncbi:MAG: Nre family DNA repair protein [Acidilobaceae archaeon]
MTCRGRGFCGLAYCPVLAKSSALLRLTPITRSNVVEGSSPPSVFVGRTGYPKVRIGPATPPETGDTKVFDFPELWLGLKLEEVLDYRLSMVYGWSHTHVLKLDDKLVEELSFLALSSRPVDVFMVLAKPPKPRVALSEELPPMGPGSPLEKIVVKGNLTVLKPVEKVYSDIDLKTVDAVWTLYKEGVPVSHIQRLLSVGALGTRRARRLVPTRWSITAVDSILSRTLLKKVKSYEPISEIEVYLHKGYDNLFIAVLLPRVWSFEWMEAWWPGSTWNPTEEVVVEGDYELYDGRTDYPSIGGCYYASMLAVLEHLEKRRKQAAVIMMREIYEGFNIPIGVWFVREMARAMFRKGPILRTNELKEVAELINKESRLSWKRWFRASRLLKTVVFERSLDDYLQD